MFSFHHLVSPHSRHDDGLSLSLSLLFFSSLLFSSSSSFFIRSSIMSSSSRRRRRLNPYTFSTSIVIALLFHFSLLHHHIFCYYCSSCALSTAPVSLTLAGKPIREDGNHSSLECISICNTTYSLKSSLIFHSNTVSLNRHERDSKDSKALRERALTYHPRSAKEECRIGLSQRH